MSARFEELDWQQTSMGELTLRRRFDLTLGLDIFEAILGYGRCHGARARVVIKYLSGHEPDFWEPTPGLQAHRFALGNVSRATASKPPLIAICMNPSNATDAQADRTVNRLIEASMDHGYGGWIMLNLYPQRAANARNLTAFDQALSDENCAAIERVIRRYGVDEVLGAWGGLKYPVLRTAKLEVRALLARLNVRMFTWDPLTGNEPRHPNPRGVRLAMLGPKLYLS